MISFWMRSTIVLAAFLACAGQADAKPEGSCSGNLRAALVDPLPKPLILGASKRISDTANPELTRRFVDGLRDAGLTISEQPNATLSIAVSVVPGKSSRVRGGAYQGFEWMSGAPVQGDASHDIRSAMLSISATVVDTATASQSWVGTIDCTIRTNDPGGLAEFIGKTIGSAVGRNVSDRRI
jgi:hypothetical protein